MVEFSSQGADKVLSDMDRVGKGVEETGKKGGFLRDALSTGVGVFGASLFQSAISGVTGFGKSMLMANANAEAYKMQLETVSGSQERANAVFKNLQDFAKATPFEFPELVQAGIQLEAFGMKTEDWIGTIGNTASAMGKSVDQVTQAVLDASTGEYERLKELGVKASVEGDKVKFRYMKNGQEMVAEADRNSQEMVLATLKGIWDDRYDGAMKRQSRSFLGQWSTLRDNWNLTLQGMSKPVFEFAKHGLAHANLFFDRFNRLQERGLSPFQAGLTALKWTLQDVFGKDRVNGFLSALRPLEGYLGRVWGGFKKIGGAVGDIAKAFTTGGLRKGFEALFGAGGRKLLTGFGDAAAALPKLFGDFLKGITTGIPVVNRLLTGLGKSFTDVGRLIQEIGQGDWGGAAAVFDRLIGHLGGLGSAAWDAAKAGFDAINWGGLWDTVTSGVQTAASAGITGIKTTISLIPELAKGIWEGTGDFATWLAGKITGGAVGDGTGGPEPNGPPIPLGTVFLTAALDAAAEIKGWLAGHAGTVAGWLKAGWDGLVDVDKFILKAGEVTVSGKDDGTFAASVGTAISSAITGAGDTIADLVKSGIGSLADKFLPDKITFADVTNFGQTLGAALHDAIGTIVFAPGQVTGAVAGKIADAISGLTVEDLKKGAAAAGAAYVGISGAIAGFLVGLLTGKDAGDWSLGEFVTGLAGKVGGAIGKALDLAFGGGDATYLGGGMFGDAPDYSGKIKDAIEGVFEDAWGAFKMPELPDFVTPIANKFEQVVSTISHYYGVVKDWWDRINGVFASGQPAPVIGNPSGPGPTYGSQAGGGYSTGGNQGALQNPDVPQAVPIPSSQSFMVTPKLDTSALDGVLATVSKSLGTLSQTAQKIELAADTSAIDAALSTVSAKLDAFSLRSAKVKLDLDTSLADTALTTFSASADAFSLRTFTAKLDADPAPAYAAMDAATTAGATYALNVFKATVSGDPSEAYAAIDGATDAGNGWAMKVFTARITVDTSGLDAAMRKADEAAQYISDRLPHSPAKKGPLSRQITFDYIADAMGSAMRRVGRYADRGASAVAGAFAPVALGAGAGMSPALAATATAPRHQGDTFVIQQVTPDELVKLMRDARAGARVAGRLAPTLQARKNRTVW